MFLLLKILLNLAVRGLLAFLGDDQLVEGPSRDEAAMTKLNVGVRCSITAVTIAAALALVVGDLVTRIPESFIDKLYVSAISVSL